MDYTIKELEQALENKKKQERQDRLNAMTSKELIEEIKKEKEKKEEQKRKKFESLEEDWRVKKKRDPDYLMKRLFCTSLCDYYKLF
jgi:hypothetical protein